MPAYFNIKIEIDSEIADVDFVSRFYDVLSDCGVEFQKGYWKSEDYTYDELVAINQKYLKEPDMEDGSLYQVLFSFNNFSEVRGYWSIEENLIFCLIIPEEDFLIEHTDERVFRRENNYELMKKVRDFAIALWERIDILIIQTAWECSDVPFNLKFIERGKGVQVEPFAIIPKHVIDNTRYIEERTIAKDGVLVENDRWLYL